MPTILITGSNGFLGQHLCLYLSAQGYTVIATGRGPCRIAAQGSFQYESLDLTDPLAVDRCLTKYQPSVVIHNAAMSKPDECEQNRDLCLLNNVSATAFLLSASQSFRPHFIYISTDFIFGENGPHPETAIPAPLNFYGETKLQSEKLVKESGLLFSIVRPVFIYGPSFTGMRPSFLHWVKQNLEAKKKIKVVIDQQRTPTFVTDICKGIETILLQQQGGDFHLAGKDILSPYQMAVKVAEVLNLDVSFIEQADAASFPEPVKRAKKSGLKIEKARQILDYNPVAFTEGIALTFKI
jgi:dTDP-4-dehydrorhamnose reductase